MSAVRSSVRRRRTGVYSIGTVPPGSIFDVPGAVTSTQVGDGSTLDGEAFLTPLFLGGDTLDSESQLNLFDASLITGRFSIGPTDGSGANSELNVFGGSTDQRLFAQAGGTINISGGVVGANANGQGFYGLTASFNSTVNISGGSVGDAFGATCNCSAVFR